MGSGRAFVEGGSGLFREPGERGRGYCRERR